MAHRRVQGVALARWDQVSENLSAVGVHDGQLTIKMVADERRKHDVEGTDAVNSRKSRVETSRQFLQGCVISLSRQPHVRLTIVSC